ncbi:nucleotidyl transferase AbiEii/AbiGii toxin family protein [Desulfatiglans anilini]|uniref:nucleotidyl transferase AbiEii/AbiGii toxin family protein n=1 Tax=Desulfatiglans anilini TaxID=90728 RepID=UPI0012946BEA|nr:nucleotidyl transferase AbiEii/AbiGii toxin family protein [Desulfatiglans anilini]
MYPTTISDGLYRLLKRLDRSLELRSGYLGGGTALALQLGHRRSDDLDFFSPELFSPTAVLTDLEKLGLAVTVLNQTPRHTELLVQRFKVDLLTETIPLKRLVRPILPEIRNLKMADAADIGRMKLLTVASRGCKKDFLDIFCLTRHRISLKALIDEFISEGQGVRFSKLLFLKGLVDFEAADLEPDPVMLWNLDWNAVKEDLISEVKQIAHEIC